tara:strand:- start:248 stop:421 length:174 start_codon:yes stop_codon:yes gene_type:complete
VQYQLTSLGGHFQRGGRLGRGLGHGTHHAPHLELRRVHGELEKCNAADGHARQWGRG